jgi:hypothetical protein
MGDRALKSMTKPPSAGSVHRPQFRMIFTGDASFKKSVWLLIAVGAGRARQASEGCESQERTSQKYLKF